jgi:hypothetical protein
MNMPGWRMRRPGRRWVGLSNEQDDEEDDAILIGGGADESKEIGSGSNGK